MDEFSWYMIYDYREESIKIHLTDRRKFLLIQHQRRTEVSIEPLHHSQCTSKHNTHDTYCHYRIEKPATNIVQSFYTLKILLRVKFTAQN